MLIIIHFQTLPMCRSKCSWITKEVPVHVRMILLQTSARKASECRDAENASIQDDRDTDTKKPEEEEIEYASITINHPAEAK